MERPISKSVSITFLVHMIIAAVFGLLLWLIPGRALTFLGWVPASVQLPNSALSISGQTFVDPTITRMLGAALLALAFSSLLGWRAKVWGQVAALVALEAVFCILSVIGIVGSSLRMGRPLPVIGWVILVIFTIFAIIWVVLLQKMRAPK